MKGTKCLRGGTPSMSKTLEDVGAALVGRNMNASLLVLQAAV
jgi:hypothetical protein